MILLYVNFYIEIDPAGEICPLVGLHWKKLSICGHWPACGCGTWPSCKAWKIHFLFWMLNYKFSFQHSPPTWGKYLYSSPWLKKIGRQIDLIILLTHEEPRNNMMVISHPLFFLQNKQQEQEKTSDVVDIRIFLHHLFSSDITLLGCGNC